MDAVAWVNSLTPEEKDSQVIDMFSVLSGFSREEMKKLFMVLRDSVRKKIVPKIRPGILGFIENLHSRKIPIVIVSGAKHSLIEHQFNQHALLEYISPDMVIGKDDLPQVIHRDKMGFRAAAIESAMARYPGHTLLYFNDWLDGIKEVISLGGITFGILNGKGREREFVRKTLVAQGADFILEGWHSWPEIFTVLNIGREDNKIREYSVLETQARRNVIEDKIYTDTQEMIKAFESFLKERANTREKELKQLFPEIHGYLYQSPEETNYDASPAPVIGRRNLSLPKHIIERGLGRKLLGLERQDLVLFQDNPGISREEFKRLSKIVKFLNRQGLLSYLRCAFLHHDVSKAGLKRLRRIWRQIKGLDLLIPNKASALILRDKIYPASPRRGLFENIALFERHPHRGILNEFFYRVIETRGLAGQWIRGEVTYEVFEDFTNWLRGHLDSLAAAFGCKNDLNQAAQRIADTVYLFNFLDTSSIREGLMDSRLNRKFEEFFTDFCGVITSGNSKFPASWQGLLFFRWDNFRSDEPRREYLKDRLGRFREERRDIGETKEETDRIINSLSPQALSVFFDNIRYFQGWYVESAAFGLMPEAQIKVIALALAVAKRKGLDMTKPFHINFFKLMRLLSGARHKFDPYKTRILEAILKDISLEDILLKPETAEPFDWESLSYQKKQLLGAVSMLIDGQKAVSFDFSFSDEALDLLRLIYRYERSSLIRHQQTLNMLLDILGLRRDQFDRVGSQDTYMKAMASSQDDKAGLLSYGKGPVWVDIGPADGPTLEIAQKMGPKKGIKRILAIEISLEAIKALNKRKAIQGLSLVTAIRGDACELRELLREEGIVSADTIVFSSILHEIYSYSLKDGRRFNLDSVKDALREGLLALSGGGRLLIRDGVIPENGEENQILELSGETNKEVFDYFVRNFPGRDLSAAYRTIDEDSQNQLWRIIIKRKDAMEFLFKLTWCWRPEFNPCTFWDEVKEQYGVLTRKGYLGLLYEIANEQMITIKEISLPKEEQSYLQPGYVNNLKGKARLLDLEGNEVSLPDSNMRMVIERTGAGIMSNDIGEGALKQLYENTLTGLNPRTSSPLMENVLGLFQAGAYKFIYKIRAGPKIVTIVILTVFATIPPLSLSIKENPLFALPSPNVNAQEENKSSDEEISKLICNLGEDDELIRLAAADALRQRIDKLIQESSRDYNAISKIGKINAALIKALGDKNDHVRYHAADILNKGIEILNIALKNNSIDVRWAVVESLGKAGVALSREPLFPGYSPDKFLRVLIEALVRGLEDKEAAVCNNAAFYLEEIGRPAVNYLISILENANPSPFARDASCRILGAIGDKKAIEPLAKALTDGKKSVCYAAIQALMKMGEAAKDHFIDALENNDDYIIRSYAAEALGEIANAIAVEALSNALGDKSSHVRSAAITLLVKEAIKAIKERLRR